MIFLKRNLCSPEFSGCLQEGWTTEVVQGGCLIKILQCKNIQIKLKPQWVHHSSPVWLQPNGTRWMASSPVMCATCGFRWKHAPHFTALTDGSLHSYRPLGAMFFSPSNTRRMHHRWSSQNMWWLFQLKEARHEFAALVHVIYLQGSDWQALRLQICVWPLSHRMAEEPESLPGSKLEPTKSSNLFHIAANHLPWKVNKQDSKAWCGFIVLVFRDLLPLVTENPYK